LSSFIGNLLVPLTLMARSRAMNMVMCENSVRRLSRRITFVITKNNSVPAE